MSLVSKGDLKLYTVAEVAELFPAADKRKHVQAVLALILKHGTYRQFGEQILLMESDVRDLLGQMRKRGPGKSVPLDTDLGEMLVMGHPTDHELLMYVGFAPEGHTDRIVTQIATLAMEPGYELLDWCKCTYGDFRRETQRIKEFNYYGYWYRRTAGLVEWIRKHCDVASPLDEQEE
jgi:hypothetical protein